MKYLLLLSLFIASLCTIGQNNAPVAVDDTIYYSFSEVHEFDSLRITTAFLFNDSDPDGANVFLVDVLYSGVNSMVPIIAQGKVIWLYYMAPSPFSGTDTFQYIIGDYGNPVKYDTGTVTMIIMRKGYEKLNANNINATIRKDVLFSAPVNSGPGFETPNHKGIHSIFATNIWVSGLKNGVVHSNIRQFGGNTYQGIHTSNNGPVSNTSHTDSLFNTKWDRVWEVWRQQIDYHILHWSDIGYQPAQALMEWPAHGSIVEGEVANLAAFFDNDLDGIYNPMDGDYPEIKGDQAIYFIYNDGNSPTSVTPMVSEVHGMAYAFSCQDSALQNTIFVDYWIYNRSQNTYDSTYISMWSDMDLGNAQDDYVQCDVMRNLFFMFNGDDFDDANAGRPGYEDYPGSQGVVILKGAKKDNDGMDNNFGIGLNETVNGTGFGDGITDNELWGMEFFTFSVNSISNNPKTEQEFRFIQTNHDLQGNQLASDFNSNGTQIPYKFMFTDTSDPYFYGTRGITIPPFTEIGNGNAPADRRILASTGPVTFAPGDVIELTYAFVFGRDYVNAGAQAGVTNMLKRADSIRSYYDQGMLSACGFPLAVKSETRVNSDFKVYPNPTQNVVHIKQQKAKNIIVEVVDATGKLILSTTGKNQLTTIDLSGFTNGLYFIKVSSDEGFKVTKVIKE